VKDSADKKKMEQAQTIVNILNNKKSGIKYEIPDGKNGFVFINTKNGINGDENVKDGTYYHLNIVHGDGICRHCSKIENFTIKHMTELGDAIAIMCGECTDEPDKESVIMKQKIKMSEKINKSLLEDKDYQYWKDYQLEDGYGELVTKKSEMDVKNILMQKKKDAWVKSKPKSPEQKSESSLAVENVMLKAQIDQQALQLNQQAIQMKQLVASQAELIVQCNRITQRQ